MSQDAKIGIARVQFTYRLSRGEAVELRRRLHSHGLRDVFVHDDRRGVTLLTEGEPWEIERLYKPFDLMNIPVQLRYEHPDLEHRTQLTFHLSPVPTTDRLKAICDQLRELSGVRNPQWFSGPNEFEEFNPAKNPCCFLHVELDPASQVSLREVRTQVVSIVNAPMFRLLEGVHF